MGLIQAELERRGVVTASVSMLRSVTERVRPPRALVVPFPHGQPLGRAGAVATQHRVLAALLALVEHAAPPPPVIVEWRADVI
ncbi:hypothetical protein [Haliangium sp.]|uniref:hypothetical protein n=1 Tax=Haliangium sp. TaxID=2663208 RepID=UPI003D12C954